MSESTYLLDTSAFVKAATSRLTKAAHRAMHDESNRLLMSSVSLVELAMLMERSRITQTRPDIDSAIQDLGIEVIPFRLPHAFRYFALPFKTEHTDPMDRMIIATALEEGLPVITSDQRFEDYQGLKVIW